MVPKVVECYNVEQQGDGEAVIYSSENLLCSLSVSSVGKTEDGRPLDYKS